MQRHLLCDDLIGCLRSQLEFNQHFMSANDIVQILTFAFTAALLNYIPLTVVHGRKSFQSSVDILDSRSVKTIRPILSFFLYKLLDYVNLIKIKVDHQKQFYHMILRLSKDFLKCARWRSQFYGRSSLVQN